MPRRTLCTSLLLLALTGGACMAAEKIDLNRTTPVPANQPVPVQDFFRPRLFQTPQLNDAGTHLAARVPLAADKTGLIVIDLDKPEGKPLVLAVPGERTVDNFEWLSDDRLLVHTSAEETGEIVAYIADVSRSLHNYPVIEGAGVSLVSAPDARQNRPLLMMRWDIAEGNGRKGQVVEVNTDLDLSAASDYDLAGGSTQAKRNRNDRHILSSFPDLGSVLEIGYIADKVGELAFGLGSQDGVSKLHRLEAGAWKECPVNLDDIDVVTCGERPGELIVRGPRTAGKPTALRFMDGATGTLGEPILEDPGYDFYGTVVRDPRTHQLLGLTFDRSVPAVVWLTEEYRAVQKFLEANFQGKVVRPWPADKTGNNVFLQTYSDRQPTIYYRANLEKKTLGLIKSSAPWIDPERMQPMTMMKFKTAEGARLDAYVTLPAGTSKEKPAPLVVLPHGGPWTRDVWGFDEEAQFLASRGFAVLQPNYRGSTGTDWMFPYEDRWAFRKMHDDVTAAVKALLKSGLIDPDRVAIMGTRFGGYLAVSGAVHEPSLYRCAVTVSGIFDWAERMEEIKPGRFDDPEYDNLLRWLGNPKDQPEKFAAISPGRSIENVRATVLVAYDKDERAATTNESRRLIDALKKYNVAHEVVTATGETQGWGHFAEKVELYSRIAVFLQKNMTPRAAAPTK